MAEQKELTPIEAMKVAEMRSELKERGLSTQQGKNRNEVAAALEAARGAVAAEDEPIEGEIVEEEVEPTPEEASQDAPGSVSQGPGPGEASQLAEAEGMALELRERAMAIGPQPTIPALAELNAISVVAERLASSGIVPSAYRNRPDDVVAAILMGRELGIGPMQSLKDIAVIDGRPALAAHLQLAVLRRAGVTILESDVNDERAFIKARRPDGEVGTVEWTYDEASKVRVGNSGKTLVDKDNWKNYRQDMLWARAVGRWTRRYGSDLVAGMPYTAEEVRDFDDNDSYGYGESKPVYRQDAKENVPPKNRAELLHRFANVFGDGNADDCKAIAAWYVKEALQAVWKVDRFAELDGGAAITAAQKIASTVMLLEDETPDLSLSTGVRETVATAFAKRLDGVALVGPPWRLGPDEESFPVWEKYKSKEDEKAQPTQEEIEAASEQVAAEAEDDIPFGETYG